MGYRDASSNEIMRPPSTVSDYDDASRRRRIHETRLLADSQPWVRRAARSALGALAVGAVTGAVFMQYWQHDVLLERERLSQTQPVLHDIYEPENLIKDDTAVVVLAGLGNLDGVETAKSLNAYRKMGNVWAIQYDNEGIDVDVITQLILKKAKAEGISKIIPDGHSMGGINASKVARHIYEETDLDVPAVVLDCPAFDIDAVRSDAREQGETMARYIGLVPGARDSRLLRFAVEMGARSDRFINGSYVDLDIDQRAFFEATDEVLREKIFPHDIASNRLIESQFLTIVSSRMGDDVRALTQPKVGKRLPEIALMRPERGENDTVIDVDYVEDQMRKITRNLSVVALNDTGHANPNQRPEEYNQAIEKYIVPLGNWRPEPRDAHVPDLAQGK